MQRQTSLSGGRVALCDRHLASGVYSALWLAPDAVDSAFSSDPVLERLGLEFLVRFLELARVRQARNQEILAELGSAYTRLGKHREGLAVDQELVRLAPDNATAHYNLGCSLALCGEVAAALDALERAVELGYDDAQHLEHDADLRALRREPRFDALIQRLRGPRP